MASVARTPRLKWHTVARTELQRPLAPKRRSEKTRASSWPGSTPSRYTAELSHGNPCTRRRQKFVLRTSDVRRSEKLGLNWGVPPVVGVYCSARVCRRQTRARNARDDKGFVSLRCRSP